MTPLERDRNISDKSEFAAAESFREELESERLRLTRDGALNLSAYLVAAFAGMIQVPALLSGLNHESYGVWIAAIATQYAATFLSAGLGRCVAREVAQGRDKNLNHFISVAGIGYLAIGTVGAILIAAIGMGFVGRMHLTPASLPMARAVFGLAGVCFFWDQVQAFGIEVLTGLRSFFVINLIGIVSAVLRTGGIILLLRNGSSLLVITLLHTGVSAASALTAYLAALYREPGVRPRFQRFQWHEVHDQFNFSAVSQLTAVGTTLLWRSAPYVLGIARGAAAIVPYELGQKFPMSISSLSWQAAEVLFPAASQYDSLKQNEHLRQLLEVGTRSVLLFILPPCIALWFLAPNLLFLWIGSRSPELVAVMRLITLAVAIDGVSASAVQIIWGKGRVGVAAGITAVSALIGFSAACVLASRMGAVGAAIALSTGVAFSAVGFMYFGTRSVHMRFHRVFFPVIAHLLAPALVASTSLYAIVHLLPPRSWAALGIDAFSSFILFAVAYCVWGAQDSERKILRGIILSFSGILFGQYQDLRRFLERSKLLRIMILYAVEVKNTLLDSSARDRAAVRKLYSEREDPFGFSRELEQFRFQRATEILEAAAFGSKFETALEIGCAEGMFTRALAKRSVSLKAFDLSDIAIERAKRNCSDLTNVEFAEWDVRKDPLEGRFDLIVATGVLEYILRPSTLRDALERITKALNPGGYLLLGNTATGMGIENTWIGKKLVRGYLVNDLFAKDPRYETIDSSMDECVCPFAHVLLRKRVD